MRLSENLYQLCGRMYGSNQNVYGIDCGDSIVLIDSGLNSKDREIIERNRSYWHLDKPVSYLLLTHEHVEHIGNAAYYQRLGAKVVCSEVCADRIRKGGKLVCDYCAVGMKIETLEADLLYEEKMILAGLDFQIESAPGHSDGCVLIFTCVDDSKVVFTGDVYLLTEMCHKIAFGASVALDFNVEKMIATAKHFMNYTADKMLPGHGEVCLDQASILFCGAYLMARQTYTSNPIYNNAEVTYADYE